MSKAAETRMEADSIRCFDFAEHAVRIVEHSGASWFVAADVCRVLEIANARDAVEFLDEDEKTTVGNPDGRPGQPGAKVFNIISESGLYALIFKSRKPQAKAFRKWVTQVVLPEIRATGGYGRTEARAEAIREEVTQDLHEMREMTSYALHGVLGGRMRLGQARVVASLVGHRMNILRMRMDLLAPCQGAAVTTEISNGKEAA